jgi:hypothetical protein
MDMAVLTFKPDDYGKVRAALVQRYGMPTSTRLEPQRIPGCGMRKNDIAQWSGDRVVVNLRRFISQNEGRATIMLKGARDSESTGTESQRTEPAQDPKDQG